MAEMETFSRLIRTHDQLIRSLDDWFRRIKAGHPDQIQCGPGCTDCCRGLFDIYLPDAVRIAAGFAGLPEQTRTAVRQSASLIQKK